MTTSVHIDEYFSEPLKTQVCKTKRFSIRAHGFSSGLQKDIDLIISQPGTNQHMVITMEQIVELQEALKETLEAWVS